MKKNVQKILSIICIITMIIISGSTNAIAEDTYNDNTVYLGVNSQENNKEVISSDGIKETTGNNLGDLLKPVFVEIDENAVNANSDIFTDKKYSYNPVDYTWETYSNSFYYNQMSTDEQILYDRLDEMCMTYLMTGTDITNSNTYIDHNVTIRATDYVKCGDLDLTPDEITNVQLIFNYSNPQYYFISNYYLYSLDYSYVGLSVYDIFSDGASRADYTSQFETQITQWENTYSTAGNIYDKEKAIHDLICANVSYDYVGIDNIYNQSCVSAVLSYGEFSHKTVCAGYAKTFELLCNGAGIETVNVTSETHEWNKVRLYNNWYNVDCTWDDGSIVAYDYFNMSDTTILNQDQDQAHTSEDLWTGLLPACNNDFNYATGIISNYIELPELSCQTVEGGKQITLTDVQDGAIIYYTTDGSTPQIIEAQKYTDSFTVSTSCTVKAIAVYSGYTSNVETIPVQVTTVDNPTITYEGNNISISCNMPGVEIYYTTDGSTPSVTSNLYTGSFAGNSSTSIKAIAVKRGYANSNLTSYQRTQAPVISTTDIIGGKNVTISCGTNGSVIYYTVDGSTPTTSSAIYSGAFKVTGIKTIRALAVCSGYENSDIASIAVGNNGLYTISSALNSSMVIDVAGGSKASGANVQIYSSNNSNAQKFYLNKLDNGNYSIINANSGKVLDVQGAGMVNGTNVWQYESNGSLAQQWIIESSNDGYFYLKSALNGLYLDINGGSAANGNNVQVWTGNQTNAQKFSFNLVSAQTLADGIYRIATALDNSKVLDIAGGSPFNGANLQIYSSNGTYAQMFSVKYLNNGYYSLTSIVSDKAIDVAGAGRLNGTNVWQYDSNASEAQQWIIKDNGDGTYSLISKCNGLYLDVNGGSTNNGTNVQTWSGNNSNAQKFVFIESTLNQNITNGTYIIESSINSSKVLDIAGGSISNGANLQLYDSNGTAAQKFQITYLNNGYYSITSINSSKVLDVAGAGTSNGTSVWQYTSNNSLAQQWLIKANGDGTYSFVSKCNSLYLDVNGGSISNGTKIQVWTGNDSKAQRFNMIKL